MNDKELDMLIECSNKAADDVVIWKNFGLTEWTDRVMVAARFIPTLIAAITQLRAELAVSRSKQGGHFVTVTDGVETRTTCSTCGSVTCHATSRTTDLRQVVQAGEVEASAGHRSEPVGVSADCEEAA